MGELVNLNRARKIRARAADKAQAAANRAKHSRSKAESSEAQAEENARDRALDGAKRERDEP